MYETLKAKILILPDWLDEALKAHSMKPADIVNVDGLESILSADDVRFYLKQVNDVINAKGSEKHSCSPLNALLDSFDVLHTNTMGLTRGGSQLEQFVKINTLYGNECTRYDFFEGLDMLTYLPRTMAASMDSSVLVIPLLEYVGNDLFTLRFGINVLPQIENVLTNDYPNITKTFTKDVVTTLVENLGFERVYKTKIFDMYCVIL